MNKIVLVFGGGLVLLLAIILFVASIINPANQSRSNQVTPIPTGSFGLRAGVNNSDGSSYTFDPNADPEVFKELYNPKRTNGLSGEEQQALEKFLQIGDIITEDFTIAYSPYLNQFFVQLKSKNGQAAFNKLLAENNMLDLKNRIPDLFVITEEDPRNAIAIAEEQTKIAVGDEKANSSSSPKGKTDDQKELAPMTNLTIALLHIGNKDEPTNQSGGQPSGKGSVDCSKSNGNEKILCAARAYDGFPYKNSGPGATFGHPPSAWVQGFESGNPSFRNLDCSGLVNVAMFKAFGQDMQAFSGTYYGDSRFRHVSLAEGRPGDLVIMGGPNGVGNLGHIAIFESFDGNHLQIFNAAGRGVRSETGDWMKTRIGFQIVRYIGPGGTP